MINLVKTIESKESKCKAEAFKDDLINESMFSSVDQVPIPGQKLLKIKLAGGDILLIPGEIINNDGLEPGEKRIKATDENGETKIKMTLHADGTLQIEGGSKEMVTVLSEALQNIIDYAGLINGLINGISTATIPTALGGAVLSLLYPTYVAEYTQAQNKKTAIETSKSELDEYKK